VALFAEFAMERDSEISGAAVNRSRMAKTTVAVGLIDAVTSGRAINWTTDGDAKE
jgi:hypothetical protein